MTEKQLTNAGGTVRVAYDRQLFCDSFLDTEIHEHPICGVGLWIRFEKEFQAWDSGTEPEGAYEIARQLRVSYTPEQGIEFHSSKPDLAYTVVGYELSVEPNGPGYCFGVTIDETTFNFILETHRRHFTADSRLQNGSYWLVN